MANMNTYTGRKFDPLKISEEDICLEDIAHALSMLCRGGGHLTRFYTVAQHSINCANEAKARGWSNRSVLACLLHDASEAYISDIIRPVKVHLTGYYAIEEAIMDVIWKRFGLQDLTEEEQSNWKQIDDEILGHEMKAMFPGEKDLEVCELVSSPDLTERPYREVEKEFYDLAVRIMEELQTEML